MNRTLVHHQCEVDVIADSKAIGFLRCSAQCSGLYGDCSKRVGLYAAGSRVVNLIQYPRMAVEFERGAGGGVCQTLFGPPWRLSLFVKAVVFMASGLRVFVNQCLVTQLYPDTTR